MAYAQTDLGEVLQAFVAALIAGGDFTADNCFLAMNRPDALPGTTGDAAGVWAIVYPQEGTFDGPMIAGGGQFQTPSSSTIVVEVYSPALLDMQARDGSFLTHASLGIAAKMKAALKAITCKMLVNSGNDVLAEPPRPQTYQMPQRADELTCGNVAIAFETFFIWNLS